MCISLVMRSMNRPLKVVLVLCPSDSPGKSQGLAAPAWRSDWALFFVMGSVLFPCREFDGCWVHFRPRFVQPRGDGLARCLPRQETHQSFKGRGRASCLQQWCCLGPEWISGRVGGHWTLSNGGVVRQAVFCYFSFYFFAIFLDLHANILRDSARSYIASLLFIFAIFATFFVGIAPWTFWPLLVPFAENPFGPLDELFKVFAAFGIIV